MDVGENMKPLMLKLHWKHVEKIRQIVDYEEPRVIKRANILNCLHLGYKSNAIAAMLNVSQKTVANIANVYLESGLESALHDDERSGRPVDIDDRDRSRIIAMVCADPPSGRYRWTLDLIVEEAVKLGLDAGSISREQVRILLEEHDLKPWREKMWCIGKINQQYIDRMENILDVYERPYDKNRPVVCIDEKPIPLISDSRPRVPATESGDILKKDYEYKRGGSVNVFCGVEPKAGLYFNKVTPKRKGCDFAEFLEDISNAYLDVPKITLVMDNLSTHKFKSLEGRFGEEKAAVLWSRFEIFYTPLHASWLNQAEIAIGMYNRQCLGDGRVGSAEKLGIKTTMWNSGINKKKTKIEWRFNKSKARKSFGYENLSDKHS
jgi:transposase